MRNLILTTLALMLTQLLLGQKNEFDSLTKEFILYTQQKTIEKVYLQTDKPFYKPGDDIWFSAYITSGHKNVPSELSQVLYVELINPKGTIEKKIKVACPKGKGKGDFHLDKTLAGGLYKLKAYTNWMKNFGEDSYFDKELQVQTVILPKLLMNLDFERKAYGAGDNVFAKLSVNTIDNRPLANHKIKYKVQLNGNDLLSNDKKNLGEDGLVYLDFLLPKDLNTSDGILNVMIDYEGSTESISRSIPIVLNNIDLQFLPEGGFYVNGLTSMVAFKAINEFGKPADIEGEILDSHKKKIKQFKSYHQGMGCVEFTPTDGNQYVAVITKPEGINKEYLLPKALQSGFVLHIDHLGDSALNCRILATKTYEIVLMMQMSNKIIYSNDFHLKKGDNIFNIKVSDYPAGIVQITLIDKMSEYICERLTFINKQKQFKIDISTNKEKYQPREKIELKIKTTDNNGNPLPARLSLAVVDNKLISFADDKQDNILSSFFMKYDIKGKIVEPSFYFKPNEPKADSNYDYIFFIWQSIG